MIISSGVIESNVDITGGTLTILNGGIARTFSDMLNLRGFEGSYHIRAIRDGFVKQMSVDEALHMLRLDSDGMVENIKKRNSVHEKKTGYTGI